MRWYTDTAGGDVAYMLGDVANAPFVRLTPVEGSDPVVDRFLQDAWSAHLRRGGGRRLERTRYAVRLQIEYAVEDGELTQLYVEIVQGVRESAFDAALFGALRATGCLLNLPIAYQARSLLANAVFEVPADAREEPSENLRAGFLSAVRDPTSRLVRTGLLAPGDHLFTLGVRRGSGGRWHVSVTESPGDGPRDLVLGALAGVGLLAAPTDAVLGEPFEVLLRLRVPAPPAR